MEGSGLESLLFDLGSEEGSLRGGDLAIAMREKRRGGEMRSDAMDKRGTGGGMGRPQEVL